MTILSIPFYLPPLFGLILLINLVVRLIRNKGFLPRWLWITMLVIFLLWLSYFLIAIPPYLFRDIRAIL